MSIVEVVLEVHDHLDDTGLAHAFGGALALAHVAEPRGTADIDVNVFAPVDELDDILGLFAALELRPEADRSDWLPSAGIRLRRTTDPFPVDVFPSLDPLYARAEARVVRWPFGPRGDIVPFLGAEDLTVFKLSFGRSRDWVDIEATAAARPDLDLDYVERQLLALRGPTMHPRLARLRRILRAAGSPG